MKRYKVTIDARVIWNIPVEAQSEIAAKLQARLLLAHRKPDSLDGAIEEIDSVTVEEQGE